MQSNPSQFRSIGTRRGARLGACLGLLLVATAAIAKPTFTIKPPPTWARTTTIETDRHAALGATGSSSLVLDDSEIRVAKNSVERFFHYAQRIETTAGLDDVSQLKFYFEPSYQELTIHFIRIHRGGAIIDALKPAEIKTIQQEEELDEQLYNGTFASVVFMNDLRVGDVVDYAYTVSGENPVMAGRFADRLYLADDRAAQTLSVRLLWPSERPPNIRNHRTDLQPAIQNVGEETEYLWERKDVPAVQKEDSTPGWVETYPAIDIGEFKNWDDVVNWALPLFKITGPTPPELQAKIDAWKRDFKTPEEQLVAALRFVQDEVRYLGIELGRYSHQPNPPGKVFARRFGDCKDKSLLLSLILNAMGIDAAPALANTRMGKALDDWQPTPYAFNHVIVQAKLAGKTYWLDSTIAFQRGGLAEYYSPPYARALVLRPGTNALEKIPATANDSGSTNVHQVYTVNDYTTAVTFVVTTVYSGSDADAMRYRLASESPDGLAKAKLNYYASQTPSIQLAGPHQVSDDQKANVITVTERYLIDDFWNGDKHTFYADQIYGSLSRPGVAKRSTPFEINHPVNIRQTIEIDLPQVSDVDSDAGNIADEALWLTYSQSMNGRRVDLDYSLKSLDDHVAAAAIGRHLETIQRMRDALGIELPRGRAGVINRRAGRGSFGVATAFKLLVLPLLAVLGFLVYKLRTRRKEKIQWNQPVKVKPGSSVDSAIPVRTPSDIAFHLGNFECTCGKHPYRAESPPVYERFTYDGQSLTGVRMKCEDCGRSADFYFRESPPTSQPLPITTN
jgi:Domain of Unknown Function with PDB structure (DUF3857)